MNSQRSIIHRKLGASSMRSSVVIVSTFICSVLLSPANGAAGVNPPPDGCYANYTTAEGCSALVQLASGIANSGLGWYALFSDISSNYNTGIGAGALALNNADANTAVGVAALILNTAGTENTATGAAALLNNDSSSDNSAFGAHALRANIGGTSNSAFGWSALMANTIGTNNTAAGYAALLSNMTGGLNTAVGDGALFSNVDGGSNTALGTDAGYNITGSSNIDVGNNVAGVAGESNTIRIGDNLPLDDSACYIGGIFGQTTASTVVYVDLNGKLGTMTVLPALQRRHQADGQSKRSDLGAQTSDLPVTRRRSTREARHSWPRRRGGKGEPRFGGA